MLIVDGQVHIWRADSPERPWPSEARGLEHRELPLGAAELLGEMDRAGVTRAVLVPPSWEGDRNDLALQAAADHPDRFAVMGRLDIREADPERVLEWRAQRGMLGIRLTFHRAPHRGWLTDGTADWFWPAAEAARVPVMVYAPGQAEALGDVATSYPYLPLIIDHLGLGPGVQEQGLGPAIAPVLDLADRPNVAVKVSALPCYVSDTYPFPILRPHVQLVVETFGASRCFWGSDLSRLPCPYGDWVRFVTEDESLLSGDDRALFMGRGLAQWLSWPMEPD
jgi:predicted TIM-barrel fold metal-dependent hydrolase